MLLCQFNICAFNFISHPHQNVQILQNVFRRAKEDKLKECNMIKPKNQYNLVSKILTLRFI